MLIVITALGVYIWAHRASPSPTQPHAVIKAATPAPAAVARAIIIATPTPAPVARPIIIANAPDGSLENRFNKGANAQTSLTTGATWK